MQWTHEHDEVSTWPFHLDTMRAKSLGRMFDEKMWRRRLYVQSIGQTGDVRAAPSDAFCGLKVGLAWLARLLVSNPRLPPSIVATRRYRQRITDCATTVVLNAKSAVYVALLSNSGKQFAQIR